LKALMRASVAYEHVLAIRWLKKQGLLDTFSVAPVRILHIRSRTIAMNQTRKSLGLSPQSSAPLTKQSRARILK
jgi:hypothetical protein